MHFEKRIILKEKLLVVLVILLPLFINAQSDLNRIDSLIQILDHQEGSEKVETMLALSEAYDLISFDKSIKIGQDAIAEAEESNLSYLKAKVLKSLGSISINNNDFELAEEYSQAALEIFRQLGDSIEMGSTIHNIGLIQSEIGRYEDSEKNFLEAIEIFKKVGLEKKYAESYQTLGTVYYSLGQFDAALDMFKQSQIIYLKENDSINWASVTYNVSMVYWQWDKSQEAHDLLDILAPVFQRFDCQKEYARAIYSKGLIYLYDFGDKEKALTCFNQSLEINKKIGTPSGTALNYINIANVLLDMEMHKKAFEYFERGLSLNQSINNVEGIMMSQYYIGMAYQKLGDYKKSNEMLSKCMELAKSLNTHNYDVIVNEAKIKNYFVLRDQQGFEEAFMSYKANFDSLHTVVSDIRMKEARGRYKNDELISALDKEAKLNEQLHNKVVHYRIVGGTLVFGFVLLFIYVIVRKKPNNNNNQ